MITFFYKPFIYIGLTIKLDGEIRKNLYTLFHLQSEIIKEEKMEALKLEVKMIKNRFKEAMANRVDDRF